MSQSLLYYADGPQRRGPITVEEFAKLGLSPKTLVWYDGLHDWTPAGQAPLTASIYLNATPPPINPCNSNPPYGNDIPPMPDNHLVWAILATIFCCVPCGIVSIVFAAQVNGAYRAGDYDRAYSLAKRASTWAWISALLALVYVVIVLAAGVSVFPYQNL